MNKRQIILISGGVIILLLIILAAASLSGSQELTLSSSTPIASISINQEPQVFSQNMHLSYTQPLTIEVNQKGYEPFSVTLSPLKQHISHYTIALKKLTGNAAIISEAPTPQTSVSNDTASLQANLLQAAQNSGATSLLNTDDTLGVIITTSQTFRSNQYIAYIVQLQPPLSTNPALVVIRQEGSQYQVVLGPGTSYTSSMLVNLPQEIISYIQEKGYAQ